MLEQGLNIPVQYLLIGAVGIIAALILLVVFVRRYETAGSLRNQMLLAFVGVAAISLVLAVSAVIWQTRLVLTTQTGESFLTLAESNSQRLQGELMREVILVQNLSKDPTLFYHLSTLSSVKLGKLPPDERLAQLQASDEAWINQTDEALRASVLNNLASQELDNFARDFPAHIQLSLTDVYGRLVATGGDTLVHHYYHGDQVWWREAWNEGDGGIYVGSPSLTPGELDTTIEIAVPVYFPPDNKAVGLSSELIIGILHSRFAIHNLKVFAGVSPLGETGELVLVDDTGLILFSSNPARIGRQIPEGAQINIANNPLNWGVDPDETGQNIIHSHASLSSSSEQAYLKDLGWTIIVQQAEGEALSVVNRISQVALVVGSLALLVAIAVGIWVAQRITRPIEELTDTASVIAGGQLDRTTKVSGPSEIRTLSTAFNSMIFQLNQVLADLEDRVAARTQRLETIASLGEQLSAILDVDTLLDELVNQVKERFGYYHAHIYLLDDTPASKEGAPGGVLVVAAGTGEAGAEMKAKGHNIPLNVPASLVARAARTGQIVMVDNVRESEDWLPNPLLPNTYSEMAVPITLGVEGQVVGVLDVQEDKVAGLDEGDANLLRSLANQVAVAIRNARLFARVEKALAEAQAAQERYVEQTWDKAKVIRQNVGQVRFSLGESTTLTEEAIAKARQKAISQTGLTMVTLNGDEQPLDAADQLTTDTTLSPPDDGRQRALIAPIKLHNMPIGNLQLHGVAPDRKWTESELALIEAVIDQVAQAAETIRLLNETQERASREQLIGQISDRLRRAPDIDTLMKIGVEELSRVLKPARTFVHFGSEEELGLAQTDVSKNSA